MALFLEPKSLILSADHGFFLEEEERGLKTWEVGEELCCEDIFNDFLDREREGERGEFQSLHWLVRRVLIKTICWKGKGLGWKEGEKLEKSRNEWKGKKNGIPFSSEINDVREKGGMKRDEKKRGYLIAWLKKGTGIFFVLLSPFSLFFSLPFFVLLLLSFDWIVVQINRET